MASLDSVSIAILLGAVLVMAGILSSLLALRFGAPLLLVFLLVGMLAGDSGPGAGCSSTTSAPPIWSARWRWR
ncbi:NhaP-type Na+/H+ and K+/H+ antiporter [Bradyrhizobium elkanii]